jgi:nucleotide-binding universal stress UspA family protein
MSACMLFYDIPEGRRIKNPSRVLYPIAVRLQLSCWVIDDGDLPYHTLNRLREQGATWHVLEFSTRSAGKVAGLVAANLRQQIRETVARAQTAAARAARVLNQQDETPEERRDKFDAATRRIINNTARQLRAFKSAAQKFGVEDSTISLSDAVLAANAVQHAMQARAKEFVKVTRTLRERAGSFDPTGVITTAERDMMPPEILADYAEENDVDVTELRRVI